MLFSTAQMRDATFNAYSAHGYTQSCGGGLLQPGDFDGMAACLVELKHGQDDSLATERRRRAMKRLMHPQKGNPIVLQGLTCLERGLVGETFTCLHTTMRLALTSNS